VSTRNEAVTPLFDRNVSSLARVSSVVAISAFLVVWTVSALIIGYALLALTPAFRGLERGAHGVRRLLDSRGRLTHRIS